MANITNLIKNIRQSVFGKDVRESIAQAIEQTYEDAATSGNANMEVVDARGNFSTLKNRLDNSDNVKADKTTTTNLQSQINTEKARIDNITTLEEGSTTGDAELIDGRVQWDGTTASNIGTAIRNQVGNYYPFTQKPTNSLLYAIKKIVFTKYVDKNLRIYRLYKKANNVYLLTIIDSENNSINLLNVLISNYTETKRNYFNNAGYAGYFDIDWDSIPDNTQLTVDLNTTNIFILENCFCEVPIIKSPLPFAEKYINANPVLNAIKDIYIEYDNLQIEENYFKIFQVKKNSSNVTALVISDKNNINYNLLNVLHTNYNYPSYNEFNINDIKGYFIIDWDSISDGTYNVSDSNYYIDISKFHKNNYNAIFDKNLYNVNLLNAIKDIYIECDNSMIQPNYFKLINIKKNATNNPVHSVTIQDKNNINYNLLNVLSSQYTEKAYNEFNVNGIKGYFVIDWNLINNGTTNFTTDNYINISKLHQKAEGSALDMVFPNTIPVVVNKEIRIEFYNAIKTNNINNYIINNTIANSQFENIGNALKINTNEQSETNETLNIIDEKNLILKSATIKIKSIVNSFNNTINAMFIGDSFTDAGIYIAELKRMLGNKINLYGTRSAIVKDSEENDQSILHEGRSSWSTTNYISNASKNGVTNPFYNTSTNTFDFSYYMTNNPNFADVTDVFILLGANDYGLYPSLYVNNLKTITDSIKNYSENIRIHLMCPIPNINSGYAWGVRNYFNKFLFKNKMFDFCKSIIDEFDNLNGYSVIATNLNVDCWYDFNRTQVNANYRNPEQIEVGNDNVHPNKYGYYRIADMIYGDILEYCQ